MKSGRFTEHSRLRQASPAKESLSRRAGLKATALYFPAIGGDVRVRRRTEIIAETQEVVVRRACREAVGWCAGCSEQARMLTLQKAMSLTGASSREIHRRLEAGKVHFTETPEGFVLVCMNSLLKSN